MDRSSHTAVFLLTVFLGLLGGQFLHGLEGHQEDAHHHHCAAHKSHDTSSTDEEDSPLPEDAHCEICLIADTAMSLVTPFQSEQQLDVHSESSSGALVLPARLDLKLAQGRAPPA